jgi:hypothetical protein
MGLFDKRDKKRGGKDDFDSPVEQIDLSSVPASTPVKAEAPKPAPASAPAPAPAPSAAGLGPPEPALPLGKTTARGEARQTDGMPQIEVVKEKPMRGTPEHDDYGIDKAIELMRTLPSDNIELVVQVVKFSLQSVGIQLPTIIEDAIRRQKDIQGRIGVLRTEIADLESEIKTRKEEIDRLDSEHRETSTVRERLELAESLGKPKASEPITSATSSVASGTSSPSSANLPRVTRQTAPPPVGATTGSSPSVPTSSAPLPGVGPASSPIKK